MFTKEQQIALEDVGLTKLEGIIRDSFYELNVDGIRLITVVSMNKGNYLITINYRENERIEVDNFDNLIIKLESVLTDVLGEYNSLSEEDKIFKKYEIALKAADWFYMYSDDHRVYTKGAASVGAAQTLKNQAAKLNPQRAEELWKQYNKAGA